MSDDGSSLPRFLDEAIAHHRAGRLAEAESACRQVLGTDPQQFDALRLLGLLAHQRGADEEAARLLERATEARADVPETFNELGLVNQARNNPEGARVCFERAISLQPGFYEARTNLALLLRSQGKLQSAQTEFEALAGLHPNRADVHANLGVVLHESGRIKAAIDCYRKALSLSSRLVGVHFNLAQALEQQGDVSSAIAECRAELELDPQNLQAGVFLGRQLYVQGRRGEARECFRKVIAHKPDFVQARWCSTMAELCVAYGPDENPDDSRDAFAESLAELVRWFDERQPANGSVGVGTMQPFYLAYHERDNRSLLSRYGDLCARLMQKWQDEAQLPTSILLRSGKIRVGIVCGKIYDQSVWTAIAKGWCQHLDRERFELHLFYTGMVVDRETELAKSLVADFVIGVKDLRRWAAQILDRELDVLLYPEIGMDGMSVRLASLRLAPVQVASWGHPETSGLPTIDYYLSAADFEPPGAQAWYREKLVPLPGLGCIYEPHNVAFDASTIENVVPDRAAMLLLCPGTPYKYHPRHDAVFVEIVRRVPGCRFIFCHDIQPNVSGMVQRRLQSAFARAGIQFEEYVTFVPHQSRAGFFGLMQIADLCLDTLGFSGFNTTMQAVECGLPVVGYEGRFMRGRFASGILRRMGLSEMVATTEEQYVELIAKLASDVAYLQRIRDRIAEASAALFGDLSPLRALEHFLESTARDARTK
jgi:protein O-GlcNAc transferase